MIVHTILFNRFYKKIYNKSNKIFYLRKVYFKMVDAKYDVLPNAEMGKVVTRFPPEPSGYLHIGHVKAAMLNYHYAKHYKGKMILRFDDTNPEKEKDEYVENIKKDLASLEIIPDVVTHTSDYFDQILNYMTESIKKGDSYCDNTCVEKMREERTAGIESVCRNQTIEQNLEIWHKMIKNDPSVRAYCVRGKIDHKNKNKCLRDPVFYRFNDTPHHRLGAKWNIYPTYDFACPIVDSIEGVTHCLRTNEYADRNPMYNWVQEKTGVRKVIIYDFSRLCLVHTVLSKRTLKWFVETGKVDGWNDPRFPTVQGILRRGIKVEALKQFMLDQGPSKNTNLMEWDKIWAKNRDIIDPISKRFSCVSADNCSEIFIENLGDEITSTMVECHPKNKELGQRKLYYYNKILIENDDAKDLKEGDKITLLKWGNAFISKIEKVGNSSKINVKLALDDKDFKKTAKLNWVPNHPNCFIKVNLIEYSHLITKPKVEEDMKIEDIVAPKSKFETASLAEIEVSNLHVGDIFQFERRGFYYYDGKTGDVMNLHYIPEGKSKAVSKITMNVDPNSISKGEEKKDDKKKDDKKKKDEKKAEKNKEEKKENVNQDNKGKANKKENQGKPDLKDNKPKNIEAKEETKTDK